MPCWEVRTVSVEFKAENRDVLVDALSELGWSYNANWDRNEVYIGSMVLYLNSGQASIQPSQQRKLNELKQAYSCAAVRKVARRKGWKINFTGKTKGTMAKRTWG